MKKRILLLMPLSACSVLASLFGAERCDPATDGQPISCSIDLTTASICVDKLKLTNICDAPELCLPYESALDKLNTPIEEYDGCSTPIGCGNGLPDEGESCDDGNQIETDNCFSNCQPNTCGDGIINFADSDDPDTNSQENCEPPNLGECSASCQLNCISADDCEARVNPNERSCYADFECANEKCESTLIPDDNNECTLQLCVADKGLTIIPLEGACLNNTGVCFQGVCRVGQCGDAALSQGEECDDGNLINDDGCDQNCLLENCGNNTTDSGEECDDGNDINFDDCSNLCQTPSCGDNILQQTELCDGSDPINPLRGQSCQSLDLGTGTLACAPDCADFDISGCTP